MYDLKDNIKQQDESVSVAINDWQERITENIEERKTWALAYSMAHFTGLGQHSISRLQALQMYFAVFLGVFLNKIQHNLQIATYCLCYAVCILIRVFLIIIALGFSLSLSLPKSSNMSTPLAPTYTDSSEVRASFSPAARHWNSTCDSLFGFPKQIPW